NARRAPAQLGPRFEEVRAGVRLCDARLARIDARRRRAPRRALTLRRPALDERAQIMAVVGAAERCGEGFELRGVDEAAVERDLLGAGDLEALPLFERADEVGSLDRALGPAGA